tara:strand:+ start:26 stop:811 length:786 start_codon:yes stop_codon:yes gene_type:complete
MYGLGVNKLGVTNVRGGFNPLSLFANSEQGAWYDPSDLTTLFQNSDGTTAVAVGDPVGYIADKSGNANHAIQATSAKRPTLRESGGLYYLEFSGAQGLRTSGNVDFTGTDTMNVFVGVKKDDDTTDNILEHSANIGGNNGTFRVHSGTSGLYRNQSKGSVLSNANNSDNAAPSTNVLTGKSKISTDLNVLRIDGVEAGTSTSNQGTGNYISEQLNIGSRNNGSSAQLSGRIYSMVIRNVLSSDADIASTEAYVANKTGVSL